MVQTHIGESLTARTETLGGFCSDYKDAIDATAATFRELGPPDLCHVIKSSGSKTAQRDVSLQEAGGGAARCAVYKADMTARLVSLLVRCL